MPKKATALANSAEPIAQTKSAFFLSLATARLARPKYLKPYTSTATNKRKGKSPELSHVPTYWFAVSHMSQPQTLVSFTPISHQSPKWRMHWSISIKRCHEDEPPEISMREIKCQTGAFITKWSDTRVRTIPQRIMRIDLRRGQRQRPN